MCVCEKGYLQKYTSYRAQRAKRIIARKTMCSSLSTNLGNLFYLRRGLDTNQSHLFSKSSLPVQQIKILIIKDHIVSDSLNNPTGCDDQLPEDPTGCDDRFPKDAISKNCSLIIRILIG
jgi:hypothetical protein